MGIVDWEGVLFMGLRIWQLRGSTILVSRRLIKGNTYIMSLIRSVNYLSCRQTYLYIQGVIITSLHGSFSLRVHI